jgi:dTDP-4-amino-4,6-dideoxygalactose transaminase
LLDLKAQYQTIKPELDEAMLRVAATQYFVLGPEVQAFEEEIASYIGAKHAVGCASGSDALLLALMALGIQPGDEVICPTYTFFATAGSVARLGAVPVFADIDPVTYNLNAGSTDAAAARCKRLRAILPVHLYGQVAEMGPLLERAGDLGVPVIEDAAQAIGSEDVDGKRAGTMGRVGCFSFFPSKNLGGYGDGGLLTTADEELAGKLRILRVHGSKPKYYHKWVGCNSRLDALQAAVLRAKLKHLDGWTGGRQRNAAFYDGAFKEAGAADSSVPLAEGGFPLRYPKPAPQSARHIYNQYVIRVPAEQRDALIAHLKASDIGCEIYYPIPLHLQECFSHLGGKAGDLPESEAAARETIALPIYAELTDAQRQRVVETVVTFLRK